MTTKSVPTTSTQGAVSSNAADLVFAATQSAFQAKAEAFANILIFYSGDHTINGQATHSAYTALMDINVNITKADITANSLTSIYNTNMTNWQSTYNARLAYRQANYGF
jgi:hypothetical protein